MNKSIYRNSIIIIILLLASLPVFSQEMSCNSFHANWSPDGGKIVFDGMRDGKQGIYSLDLKTNTVSLVIDNLGRDAHPVWSPDGRLIAFQTTRDTAKSFLVDIYVMTPDRSVYKKLFEKEGFSGVPAWSLDGSKIAFQYMPLNSWDEFSVNKWHIYVMDSGGQNQKQITSDDAHNQVPNWSPDGKLLVYYSNRTGNDQIYTMNPDGSDSKRLTHTTHNETTPVFSPDGKRIAFKSDRTGTKEAFIMNADGSSIKTLTTGMEIEGVPFWSSDGERIAFQSAKSGTTELYSIDVNADKLVQLTSCNNNSKP